MLNNFPETEKQINQLKLQLEEAQLALKRIKISVSNLESAPEVEVPETTDVDSAVVGNTVIHRLKHTFRAAVTFASTLILSALTASRPLKLNASKEIISALIDVTSASDVSGATTDQVAYGNSGVLNFSSAFTWENGNLTITDTTGPTLVVWDTANSITTIMNATASGGFIGTGTAHSLFIGAFSTPAISITSGGDVKHLTTKFGFFNAAPVAQQTLAAYVSNPQSGAYVGIATGVVGTPYALVGDVNALRVAYENVRVAFEDIRTKLQGTTLVA